MPIIKTKMDSLQKHSDSDTPVLDYCRFLISEDVDPNSELHVYRGDKTEPDLIVRNIGEGSRLTIKEGDPVPRFSKYTPMSEKDKARLAKKKAENGARSDRTAI